MEFLESNEQPVVELINPQGDSSIVLVCEHASNFVPVRLNKLGLTQQQLTSHIAWDLGAKNLTLALSRIFNASAVCARVSRLVFDVNRPVDAETAMPVKSEHDLVPGNQNLSAAEKEARIKQIYQPFHQKLSELIAAKQSVGLQPILVTIHSFTPIYFGKPRAVKIGVLHSHHDSKLADLMLAERTIKQAWNSGSDLKQWVIQRNQPYGPDDGVSHTLIEHGVNNRIANVMIEIRNDLIAEPEQVHDVANKLAKMIELALKQLNRSKTT